MLVNGNRLVAPQKYGNCIGDFSCPHKYSQSSYEEIELKTVHLNFPKEFEH